MQLDCPRCGHALNYTDVPPRFCSNCGVSLSGHEVDTVASPVGPGPIDPDATVAAPRTRAALAEAPSSVGGYRLLRRLGGGGMGTVYEAEEDGTGRHVALKLIRADFADSPEAVERFRREGRLAGTISHPCCVFVLAADEEAGRPYIVMELMPGSTLQDLVAERGPLGVAEAVRKVLDVIEGLQEAHRCGVIHRDVKPGNCFLDEQGRVKVGDFGLAKSLLGPEQLTRSGAFLGTLLYASPEQIRNEAVGAHSDVYSVCATLYYLLTGRAPFERDDSDPAATLARTVSDPLTPMRRHRPELPRALDEVVLRGLARSSRQRWHDLDELRQALLPFVERTHSFDEIGWRASACLCDLLLLLPIELGIQQALRGVGLDGSRRGPEAVLLVSLAISLLCGLAWFGLMEWRWGATPGKWLMSLRVRESASRDRPALWRAVLRTWCFYQFKDFGALVVGFSLLVPGRRLLLTEGPILTRVLVGLAVVVLLPFVSSGVGLALLAVTMRRRSGYRGIHEWISGTEVIRLPVPRPRFVVPDHSSPPPRPLPSGVPKRVGAFVVRALLREGEEGMVLAGEDAVLGRPVWLWLRPQGQLGPNPARRDLARAGRPRWLAGGSQDDWDWDAYVAAPGCLLSDLISRRRRLGWADTLALLEQLSGELEQAEGDGTLPATLGVEQVWVQASGRPMLLDVAPRQGPPADSPLDLLRQTAVLALEGEPRPPGDPPRSIRAPLPGHAAAVLDRLLGVAGPFASLGEVRSALAAAREEATEISRPRRALKTALSALLLLPGLCWLFLLGPLVLVGAYMVCVVGETASDYRREEVREELAETADPAGREELNAELAEYEELSRRLERERPHVLRSWNGYLRKQITAREPRYRQLYLDELRKGPEVFDDSEDADVLTSLGDQLQEGASGLAALLLAEPAWVALLFLAWPLTWALWAGLTRGGLARILSGIALRNQDGRPASRWRCAWRSLLVWLPVAGLLLLSFWLDVWRIARGPEGAPELLLTAAAWLAWGAWWLALLLLPVYAWLAVRWPNRGPHDWLAGTYPVPR
jgi:hypothetical protein